MKFDPTLYLVTDSTGRTDDDFLSILEKALTGGVTLVQLREKERGGDVSPAAIMGKPLETMGRKATGLRRRKPLCSPGRNLANHGKSHGTKW